MRKRTDYSCGLEAAFDVIGGKWKVLILWQLHLECRRFGELKRLVEGVSEKMLIEQLREMEADGLLHREQYPEIPPRVEYSLTPTGTGLIDALAPLCQWGSRHMKRIAGRHLADGAAPKPAALSAKPARR